MKTSLFEVASEMSPLPVFSMDLPNDLERTEVSKDKKHKWKLNLLLLKNIQFIGSLKHFVFTNALHYSVGVLLYL